MFVVTWSVLRITTKNYHLLTPALGMPKIPATEPSHRTSGLQAKIDAPPRSSNYHIFPHNFRSPVTDLKTLNSFSSHSVFHVMGMGRADRSACPHLMKKHLEAGQRLLGNVQQGTQQGWSLQSFCEAHMTRYIYAGITREKSPIKQLFHPACSSRELKEKNKLGQPKQELHRQWGKGKQALWQWKGWGSNFCRKTNRALPAFLTSLNSLHGSTQPFSGFS